MREGGRVCSAWVPPFGEVGVPQGRTGGADIEIESRHRQVPTLGWPPSSSGGEVRGITLKESHPPRSPPQDSSRGLAGTVRLGCRGSANRTPLWAGDSGLTWGLNCSRRRCGGRQRPDCSRDPREGPRGTPYRGACPGRAGARGSSGSGFPLAFSPAQSAQHSTDFAVGTGLPDLAPAPPDSAFWASAARHPAPPPAPPGALLPWGLGTGEVEEGSAGEGSGARDSAWADPPRAACSLTCGSVGRSVGLLGVVGLCPPAEPRAGEGDQQLCTHAGARPGSCRVQGC